MNKPQPQTGPEIEEYSTTATPKAYAGSVPVFCAHDAIVPLKDLRPNPKNPNQHPPEQIKLLASIIRATGWRAPITVSKRSGLVTKGHGRLMAAQLDDLTDAEFVVFTDDVAGQLENSYPVYVEFVEMQGMDDTVDMVVVSTIVDELDADAHNMRHIYPYSTLVAQGVLPAGLDRSQQKAFYECFAGKVNAAYATTEQFFNAILADTTDLSQIRQMESQCANDLFSWVVTEVDITETIPAAPAAAPAQKK